MTTFHDESYPTPADQVRDVVMRLFGSVEARDITSYLDGIYHPQVIIHESPALPYGGDYHGPEGVVRHAHAFLATWAPHQTPEDRAVDAYIDAVPDHAYVRWTLRVRGRPFPVISHYRFLDGRIVESRMFPFDLAGLLTWWQQLDSSTRL